MKRLLVLLALLLTGAAQEQSPDRVRIAVAGLFHTDQFVVESSPSQSLLVRAGSREFTLGQTGRERLVMTRDGRQVTVVAGNRRLIAESVTITGNTGDAEFTLAIPSRFRRRYRGILAIAPARNELAAVVSMDTELAVASIVAAESGPRVPMEALKALAVAARSYLVAGRGRHLNADFCDTTHCQFLRNPPAPDSSASRAASETKGLVLTFEEKPFPAMYSASCGGRTHTLAELGMSQSAYPYYAVDCPFCRRNPDKWTSRIAEANAASASKGERERIQLARELGWNVVPSNNFRSERAADGEMILTGVGHGHGLGLCQRGAAAMASEGRNFREILSHYYPNTVVNSPSR